MKINRKLVHEKYNGHCGYCGETLEIKKMQVDHIVPQYDFNRRILNKYGIPKFLNHLKETDVNHFDNLMPACRVCNKWKTSNHLELFRSELEDQVNRLNLRSSNYRIAKKFGLIIENTKRIVFYFNMIKVFRVNK